MSVFIATPCFNSAAYSPFDQSIVNLRKELTASGIRFETFRHDQDSLITRARNVCAASFLNDTDFDYMAFIDADIEFSPADFARLYNLCVTGSDVGVGLYRHKNPQAKLQAWVNGRLIEVYEFEDSPFEVDYAGTGFMMIRRQTFERLKQAHPKWRYREGMPEGGKREQQGECWAFFQDPIEDGCHLSEDYFFCKRVRELGMKVVADPEIQLKHWGLFPY